MEEIWKPIKGYEGLYEVSNLGNIKSVKRKAKNRGKGKRIIRERILKPSMDRSNGYYQIKLSKNGKLKTFKIHKLVIEHFLNKISKGLVVNHIDGNKLNNNINNLEICTQKDNIRHAIDNNLIDIKFLKEKMKKIGKNNRKEVK